MFCFQCQEAAKKQECTVKGMCGKENTTANLQDLLIFNLKGVTTMAALDEANTAAYGHPEIAEVNIGVGINPGVLNVLVENFDINAITDPETDIAAMMVGK